MGSLAILILGQAGCRNASLNSSKTSPAPKQFAVTGTVQELKPGGGTVVVRHDEIPDYMPAMTMPFRARNTNELAGLQPGDLISFRLLVTDDESWIEQVLKTGRSALTNASPVNKPPSTGSGQAAANAPKEFRLTDIPEFALTNEFGQPLSFRQFQGKAVALTFFFTRCPVPEYCPRLTRNFVGALRRLRSAPDGPTNFHFLSISFDPVDTPALLRSYARQYEYDSNYWSFVTGNPEHIRDLARGFGVSITAEGGTYDHGFTTAIFDASGRLQNMWPVGGDTTSQIVTEIREGATRR